MTTEETTFGEVFDMGGRGTSRDVECVYCGIEIEDADNGFGVEATSEGQMHDSCFIDWRDDA